MWHRWWRTFAVWGYGRNTCTWAQNDTSEQPGKGWLTISLLHNSALLFRLCFSNPENSHSFCKRLGALWDVRSCWKWSLGWHPGPFLYAQHSQCLSLSLSLSHTHTQTSLVFQWLRVHLPIQGTQVHFLLWEDSTCHVATRPMQIKEACTPKACAPQEKKTLQWEACAWQQRALHLLLYTVQHCREAHVRQANAALIL